MELEIVHRSGPATKRWIHRTAARRIPVGRNLSNHLILLGEGVPPRAGFFLRRGREIRWNPTDGESLTVSKAEPVCVGPFEIRPRRVRRRLWAVLILCQAACLGVTVWAAAGSGSGESRSAAAASPELPARGEYGNRAPGDVLRELRFGFQAASGGPLELRFSSGNITRPDQLAVEVNGHYVGFASMSPGTWGLEERHAVIETALREGKNRLRFLNRYPTLNRGVWVVRNVYVNQLMGGRETSDRDPDLAFLRAQRLLEQRNTRVGNLWRARQTIALAFSGWAASRKEPPPEAEDARKAIEQAESFLISRGMSEARAALTVGDETTARKIVESLLAEFLDPRDPRRREIRETFSGMAR